MAADLTFSASVALLPAHHNGALTSVYAPEPLNIGTGIAVSVLPELGAGGGGGPTRPTSGFLYPRGQG